MNLRIRKAAKFAAITAAIVATVAIISAGPASAAVGSDGPATGGIDTTIGDMLVYVQPLDGGVTFGAGNANSSTSGVVALDQEGPFAGLAWFGPNGGYVGFAGVDAAGPYADLIPVEPFIG